MRDFSIIIVIIILLTGCASNKYIVGGNYVYNIRSANDTDHPDTIYVNKIVEGFHAKLEIKDEYIIVKPDTNINLTPADTLLLKGQAKNWQADLANNLVSNGKAKDKYYFSAADTLPNIGDTIEELTFLDYKLTLQVLSVALKVRSKIDNPLDSFPQQVETGFNPSLALGWKFGYNIYKPSPNIFGRNITQISVTPGVFIGTGAIDLKKSNTRNPVITFERKAAFISTGGFISVGYDSINIGYVFGWDFATGTGSNDWIYQRRLWQGLMFGLDIIK